MILFLVATVLVSWGIAGIFDKKAVTTNNTPSVFLVFHLFNLVAVLALPPIMLATYGTFSLSAGVVAWEGLNALAALAALAAYFWVLERASASFVLGITAGYPVVGQLLAGPLLGEPASLAALAAALLVACGVAAIGISGAGDNSAPTVPSTRAVGKPLVIAACLVACTVLWGLLGIFEKLSLQYGRPLEAYLALSLWKLVATFAIWLWWKHRRAPLSLRNISTWQYAWLSAFLVGAGNLAYVFALAHGAAAGFMIVVTAGYPLIMCVLARLVLSDRISLLRLTGICLIVAGCALVSLA